MRETEMRIHNHTDNEKRHIVNQKSQENPWETQIAFA